MNDWCTIEDEVNCDSRTSNNPRNPTTTERPTESPVLSDCNHVHHLFNLQSGSYMKSSCILRRSGNYEQAEEFCMERNMNLFVIDSSQVQATFFATTTSSLSDYNTGFVWINGRRHENGNWYTYNPNQLPIYNGIRWVESPIDGRTSGDCLRYSQEHTGNYLAMGEPCSSSNYFICEFYNEPVLNTEVCTVQSPLFDDDGTYLKTSCVINTGLDENDATYDEAERKCIDNGMTLFTINNSTVQSSLFEATTEALSETNPNGFLWINGRREQEEWFVYSPRRESLYAGVEWTQTESIDGRTSGDCLRYSQEHGPYRAKGHDCEARSWIICEY